MRVVYAFQYNLEEGRTLECKIVPFIDILEEIENANKKLEDISYEIIKKNDHSELIITYNKTGKKKILVLTSKSRTDVDIARVEVDAENSWSSMEILMKDLSLYREYSMFVTIANIT